MLLVDLNYNFECDWFVELSDNNLASELEGNRSFFKPITIEEIVIFMINIIIFDIVIMKLFLFRTINLSSMLSCDTIVKYQYHQQHNHNFGCIFIVVVNIINAVRGSCVGKQSFF